MLWRLIPNSDLFSKIHVLGAMSVSSVVECLPGVHEALGYISPAQQNMNIFFTCTIVTPFSIITNFTNYDS